MIVWVGEEYLESEDAYFSDPEWKYGRDYSEEEVSSESIGDMVISSDDVQLSDNDMEDNVRKKQPNRHEGAIDPNCNFKVGFSFPYTILRFLVIGVDFGVFWLSSVNWVFSIVF